MKELFGDLWDLWEADLKSTIVVTTNGIVGARGGAIMGRGIAKQAADRFPDLRFELGGRIADHGNHVFYFPRYRMVTFPTKSHYSNPSIPELISASAAELLTVVNAIDIERILMPRPGCGNGQLKWEDVKPLLRNLDDRYTIVEMK